MKKLIPFFLIVALLSCEKEEEKISLISISAGSEDAINQAILDIEEGGTIILEAGVHKENTRITINKRIKFRGEDGAVLQVASKPARSYDEPLSPAIYVQDVDRVCIENIQIKSLIDLGGTGILLDNANYCEIRKCNVSDHQYPIVLNDASNTKVENNYLEGIFDRDTTSHAFIIINGKNVEIRNNKITNGFFGAWLSDVNGIFEDNHVYANHIGVIPCAVPDNATVMPRSNLVGTMISGKRWVIRDNLVEDNLFFGILLYDGATECIVANNNCKNNGSVLTGVDIEIGRESKTFGFPTSISSGNSVIVGPYPSVKVKDCGENNTIVGGIVMDAVDCF